MPEGIDGFLDAFGIDRIGEVRLADNVGDKEVHLSPGRGNIDFESMFRRLESAKYDRQKLGGCQFGCQTGNADTLGSPGKSGSPSIMR